MRMNVFEMEGFLRGKCVPRDLKVNETDAEYLIRKFDALEAKCAALENKVPQAVLLLLSITDLSISLWLKFSTLHA
ncbi:hypothetical protein EEL45_26795 [Escherichia coli O157:H7]|nr:hypothetical protein EEL45_26795 [Escherichia coli O157:H7]